MAASPRAVVLVEGISDRLALHAVAERCGRDLVAEGVSVVPIGGAQAIRRSLELYGPRGRGVKLAGLCDAGEERHFRRALERVGLGSGLDRAGLERLGFYVCEADLEEELIRALGPPRVEEVLAEHGDLGLFRTFQNQPAWRGRSSESQLRRFLHCADSRNTRYPPLLVGALDADRLPRPLAGVLAHV